MATALTSKQYTAATVLVAFAVSCVFCAEEHRNHAPEKRQDDSFVFFGGWRPITPGNPFYYGSSSGPYDHLLGLKDDDKLDTSSTFFTSSFPRSQYKKDIFNYYPRPAIRPRPKPNTPLYRESTSKRRRRPQKYGSAGEHELALGEITTFPIETLHGLNLKDALVSAHDFSPIRFAQNPGGKNLELLEVTVHPIQSEIANGGNGVAYGRLSHEHAHIQAGHLQYPPIARNIRRKPNFQPKSISHSPSLEEVIDLKNVQIVEVPVPPELHHGIVSLDNNLNGHRQGQRRRPIQQQTHVAAHRIPQNPSFGRQEGYFTEPRHLGYPSGGEHQKQFQGSYEGEEQPHISAELIKVSDDQVKSLLKSLQIVDKVSKDIYRYAPLSDHKKNKGEDIQLVLALPQKDVAPSHDAPSEGNHVNGYEAEVQHVDIQVANYGDYSNEGRHPGGHDGGKHEEEAPSVDYAPNDYPADGQRGRNFPATGQNGRYHPEGHHHQQQSVAEHQSPGYEGRGHYENNVASEEYQHNGQENQQQQGHQGNYETVQHTNSYIEVNAHTGEDGYRREPILALELQPGQTVEDALKSLDAETLQKLGAHGKEGLEIQVVEMPGDEYTSESRKQLTVMARRNATMTPS